MIKLSDRYGFRGTKADRQRCIAALTNYNANQIALRDLMCDLIPSPVPAYSPAPGSSGPGRSTERTVINILNDPRVIALQRNISAVSNTLAQVAPVDREILNRCYINNDGRNVTAIAADIGYNPSTMYYRIAAVFNVLNDNLQTI